MSTSEGQPKLLPLSDSQKEQLEEATSSYQAALTDEAREYLDARGIDPAAQHGFRLGVVADPFPGHSRFKGMLSIPYLGKLGEPVALRFRCIETHEHREYQHGKYNSVTGDTPRLYNVGAIHRPGSEIHVTEGEFDAMILEIVGLDAVAVPGAALWKPYHATMLAGFSRVWVWADPDEAGEQMLAKVIASMPRKARPVRLTLGDVGETYLAGGALAIRSLFRGQRG